MGTKVSYKATRGGNEAGQPISDPSEFFATLFDDGCFPEYAEKFNALPADKKSEFLDLFDGQVQMDAATTGQLWLGDNDSDMGKLRELMDKINAIIDTC